ncbi:thymidylate synthase (FAD) [Desulfuromusa kysingii]|uniref:Flavin-dependent thymidylate synthase n=1 Tax=Desulfuromusa kysingii TaxID=37625 RepID=A0A1H3XFY4_9BACT|nr:FAD-dependent thymidylate synthase [Desulfuromusa kysingii]SDZ97532.1 thymidylate synthase (FAD) [Desulfuromusa kysingii]
MTTQLIRPVSPELDAILGQTFPVLDDGFVRVVDYMGNDSSIVQAARVSYGDGTKKVSQDRALIRYLLRNYHTTPFEMCSLKLHVRVPMDTWRQWIRHRTASVNEYSTRYSIAIDGAQMTAADQWRQQAQDNKQGSSGYFDQSIGQELTHAEQELHRLSKEVYHHRLDGGVAREQARKDLPLSTYTEAFWQIDLHNLFHFLALRMDSHAQLEIRNYAETIGEQIVSRWVPQAWEAFKDYRFKRMTLSQQDQELLALLAGQKKQAALDWCKNSGWLKDKDGQLVLSREALEFADKLTTLGMLPPWEE